MLTAAARRINRAWAAQFLRFCIVGGVGFVVDASVLLAAVRFFGADPIGGRILSFSIAVWTTFELNRRWAFRSRGGRPYLVAFASYLGVQGVGFACNFSIYTVLYLTLPSPYNLPLACLMVASGAALAVNYAGANLLVFRSNRGSEADHRNGGTD